jgi:hypothetical protein
MGLVGDYVTSFYAHATILLLWLFDPISVENRIWGDRNGTCSV